MTLGFVLAVPFLALGLQRWSVLGPQGSLVALERVMLIPLTTLSLGAGLIHLGVTGGHFREDRLSGLFFVIVGVFQVAWALFFARRPGTRLAAVGLGGNAAIVGLWALSRTAGLPIGAHPGVPEPLGLPDLLATGFEVAIVAACAAIVLPMARTALRRPRYSVASADLGMVMVILSILIATSYAMAVVSITGGHPVPASVPAAL